MLARFHNIAFLDQNTCNAYLPPLTVIVFCVNYTKYSDWIDDGMSHSKVLYIGLMCQNGTHSTTSSTMNQKLLFIQNHIIYFNPCKILAFIAP
jgi:hypothetical protein